MSNYFTRSSKSDSNGITMKTLGSDMLLPGLTRSQPKAMESTTGDGPISESHLELGRSWELLLTPREQQSIRVPHCLPVPMVCMKR